ncbi:MAG: hypothetical protein L3J67_00945 [Hyphomicrobiaceae bacterium]|nr:hypothetical protein [Hyphomicrobiaceae bacterium]
MAEILEKNRTIPLEVLLIDPVLSDGIRAYEEDAFRWEIGNFKRLNYMTGLDLGVENLIKKVRKNHEAGCLTVVVIERIDSLLVRNLSKIGDELVPFVRLANWESYDSELMNIVDFPQRELLDDDVRLTVANEEVRHVFVTALKQWLSDNMDMTNARMEEIVGHVVLDGKLETISSVPAISDKQARAGSIGQVLAVKLGDFPEKVAVGIREWIEQARGSEGEFAFGAQAAGDGQPDLKAKFFAKGTDEETEFRVELKRGGKGKSDHFIVKALSDKSQLMEHLRVFVLIRQNLENPLQLKLQRQGDADYKKGEKVLYQVEMELKPGEDIRKFEIVDMRD